MPRILLLIPCLAWGLPLAAQPPGDDSGLARRWAPLLRQEIRRAGGNGLDGRADLLAAVDFDGDWDPLNNWENAASHPLRAKIYWSVVSTASHHFVLYLLYHPRDWTDNWFSPRWRDSEHENDFEAVLLMLRRRAPGEQSLEAALCVHHSSFRAMLPKASPLRAKGEVETLRLFAAVGPPRPVLQQEARGHALKSWSEGALMADDVLLYRPQDGNEIGEAEVDDGIAGYRLESIFAPGGLFERRDERTLFDQRGRLRGDCAGGAGSGLRACEEDKASAPWAMDDRLEASGPVGALALDPARVFEAYFDPLEPFAREYESNPYVAR